MFVSEESAVVLALRMIMWGHIFAERSSEARWRDRSISLANRKAFAYQSRIDLIIFAAGTYVLYIWLICPLQNCFPTANLGKFKSNSSYLVQFLNHGDCPVFPLNVHHICCLAGITAGYSNSDAVK